MATTPNFNWSTPDNTGLVKNGALDIRTLGNSIDASMAELKGGTTGQVLSKTSNTDMDFSWVAQDDSNAIQNAIVDAKGDLIAATANDTPARIAVGANGTMLVANSAESTGLKWTTATDQFPWQTWTPTYNGITVGNGTVVARYQQVGKTVNLFYKLIFGSTSSLTGNVPLFTLPVTASSNYTAQLSAFGQSNYVKPGVAQNIGFMYMYNTTNARFQNINTAGTYAGAADVTATAPFTWGTSDYLEATITYEAA
jgi:hypothetical protein